MVAANWRKALHIPGAEDLPFPAPSNCAMLSDKTKQCLLCNFTSEQMKRAVPTDARVSRTLMCSLRFHGLDEASTQPDVTIQEGTHGT
jgi:hypothetical protein